MTRILLDLLLPLALPTLAFIAYAQIERRRRQDHAQGALAPWWAEAPWLGLVGSGVALALLSLGFWALTSGQPPHTSYLPAHLENGQLVQPENRPR